MPPAAKRSLATALVAHGWWVLPLALLVWFRQLDLAVPAPAPTLDESWHAVKGWELLTQLRLGLDSVFTYGRLGWFHDPQDLAPLAPWRLWGWEIALKLGLAALCAWNATRLATRGARWVAALSLAALAGGPDAFALLALVALFRHLLGSREQAARGEWLACVAAALLANVKFTWFLLYAAGVLLGALALLCDGPRRRAAGFLARTLASFAFLWLFFGQSLADLPVWIASSWEVARGYVDAMAVAGPRRELGLALGMLLVVFVLAALELARGERSARRVALLLLVLGATLIAYKNAFTRQIGNADIFFALAPAASWFALAPRETRLATALRAALLAAGFAGLCLTHPQRDATPARALAWRARAAARTLDELAHPVAARERIAEQGGALVERWNMPVTRSLVGAETLDLFQNRQALLLLNGFNYRPRPVFQGYSAYTPRLQALNRDFYRGEGAPEFVLFQLETIDERLAPAEDAQAFAELLLRYEPLLNERDWLLLRREHAAPRSERRVELAARALALGEWLELEPDPGEALELALGIERSLRGGLQALLLRGAPLWCELERADGSRDRRRLVPGCVEGGFLVRPWLDSQELVTRAFCGERLPGLKRLRVLAAPGDEGCFEERLQARLVRREGLLPPPRPEAGKALHFSDLVPLPAAIESAAPERDARCRERVVHVLEAPSALRWDLEPGRYRLRATYGMLDEAWQGVPDPTDGALVTVTLQTGKRLDSLFRRLLEPHEAVEDRGLQPLDLEFEVPERAQLYLRTRVGWHENATRDWTFWQGITLSRS